jgi:hypothetical protein
MVKHINPERRKIKNLDNDQQSFDKTKNEIKLIKFIR